MKRLAILGSTGSIGESALKVVDALPGRFEIVALACGRRIDRLVQQIERYRPRSVAVGSAEAAQELRARIGGRAANVLHGEAGLVAVAREEGVDLVVNGLVGALGVRPTLAALDAGRSVALANKEALVVAGEWLGARAVERGVQILPVDSEHNALHQCLRGEVVSEVRRLWLTASGGPFLRRSSATLASVTPAEALQHPTWRMGPKVTIDSATLMNKGLEVIEARWLFSLGAERIRVVVHPKSVVHSMVEFVDGSFKAQLGNSDMRHPIQYALTWPERLATDLPPFDPVEAGPLAFEAPDPERFPCLALAYRALQAGGAAPAVLNAANEVAVETFLAGRCGFLDIAPTIERVLGEHGGDLARGVEDLLAIDARARSSARRSLQEARP